MRLLHLPKSYDAVVGEPFELFYRGMLNCHEPSAFDVELSFADGRSRGAAYRRKYLFTPTDADIGEHPLSVCVRDNRGRVAARGHTVIRVHAKPKAPRSERVILCVGDSLTYPGIYPNELAKQLSYAGVDNLRFIGSCIREDEGEGRFEGYGGWTFTSYTTDFRSPRFMYIDGDFSDKDEATDQHSLWRDEGGTVWKLESVTPTRAKLIYTYSSGSGILPPSGRLTHALGGEHHGDMLYENGRQADANPFYSTEKNALDFRAYAAKMGVSHIDEVLVLLGGNSTEESERYYKARVRAFLDALLHDFPDCHVALAGCAVPDRDGMGHNYGVAWHEAEKCHFIRRLTAWHTQVACERAYRGRVQAIDLPAQFDTENNYPKAEMPVHAYTDETELVGTNALHPTREGQEQIAAIFFRYLAGRLL